MNSICKRFRIIVSQSIRSKMCQRFMSRVQYGHEELTCSMVIELGMQLRHAAGTQAYSMDIKMSHRTVHA
jgi:hypothetical protein